MSELLEFGNTEVGRVDVQMIVTEEDVDNIMVGAIEGGINHWAYVQRGFTDKPKEVPLSQWCTKVLLEGGTIVLEDVEDPSETWELTLSKFLVGLQRNIKVHNNDFDTYDAEDYDRIIQYALFGEIVYG
jgi:hypothetical protein